MRAALVEPPREEATIISALRTRRDIRLAVSADADALQAAREELQDTKEALERSKELEVSLKTINEILKTRVSSAARKMKRDGDGEDGGVTEAEVIGSVCILRRWRIPHMLMIIPRIEPSPSRLIDWKPPSTN